MFGMRSIRGRLTLVLVLSIGCLLLGAGVVFYTVISTHLVREFDQTLLTKAQALITLTEQDQGLIEFDFAEQFMPEFGAADRPEYFSLWLATGPLIATSPSLGAHELPRLPTLTTVPAFRNLVLPNGLWGRSVQVAFVPQVDDEDETDEQAEKDQVALDPTQFPDRAAVVVVARDRERLDTLLHGLQVALVVVMLALLGIMVGLIRGALRIGLRPLDEIQRQVAHLDADSLDTRLQMHTQTRELTPVVDQLNALLHRLDTAFARERQFTSDVAHELRTPVTELRTLTEVGLRWPDDREAVSQYMMDAYDISLQMERVVETLLLLTRCDSGIQGIQREAVTLREVVEMCWLSIKQGVHQKALTFHCDIPPSCVVTSDRDMLSMVLTNLLTNAVTYSPPHSQICCTATLHRQAIQLTVSNPTDTLTPEDMPYIFERFWRKDPARSDTSHAGLGLSLVKAFSDLLDFNVRATLDAQRTFAISLSL